MERLILSQNIAPKIKYQAMENSAVMYVKKEKKILLHK